MRKSRAKSVDPSGAPVKKGGLGGILAKFGKKKNPEQQYNLETAGPQGQYGQQGPYPKA
jgi:hypothetical protein